MNEDTQKLMGVIVLIVILIKQTPDYWKPKINKDENSSIDDGW